MLVITIDRIRTLILYSTLLGVYLELFYQAAGYDTNQLLEKAILVVTRPVRTARAGHDTRAMRVLAS